MKIQCDRGRHLVEASQFACIAPYALSKTFASFY